MMLAPKAGSDLYELANSSPCRTQLGFRQASVEPPAHMRVGRHPQGGLSWLDGLKKGKRFVISGPLIFAKANRQHLGHVFTMNKTTRSVSGGNHQPTPLGFP